MNLEPWRDILDRHFPWSVSDGSFTIEVVRDQCETEDGQLKACIRTIKWDVDADAGMRSVRDIKEQMVRLGRVENLDYLERYEAFIAASKAAFEAVEETTDFDTFMPVDFFFPDVLDNQNRTFDDFGKSLSVKSRYGGIGS